MALHLGIAHLVNGPKTLATELCNIPKPNHTLTNIGFIMHCYLQTN
jgi:hypothetical protein